jgi:hypothetical protein
MRACVRTMNSNLRMDGLVIRQPPLLPADRSSCVGTVHSRVNEPIVTTHKLPKLWARAGIVVLRYVIW